MNQTWMHTLKDTRGLLSWLSSPYRIAMPGPADRSRYQVMDSSHLSGEIFCPDQPVIEPPAPSTCELTQSVGSGKSPDQMAGKQFNVTWQSAVVRSREPGHDKITMWLPTLSTGQTGPKPISPWAQASCGPAHVHGLLNEAPNTFFQEIFFPSFFIFKYILFTRFRLIYMEKGGK